MTRWRPTPQDLVDSALIYALTALAICGRAIGKPAARMAAQFMATSHSAPDACL